MSHRLKVDFLDANVKKPSCPKPQSLALMFGKSHYLVDFYEVCFIHWAKNGPAQIVREPAILLIKWLRPKGLKVCSYVERMLNSKITLKKIGMVTMATQLCNSYR